MDADQKTLVALDNYAVLSRGGTGNKDTESRLRLFSDWLDENGLHWHQPDLAAYRDKLLREGKEASTTAAHLSTIRATYRRLLVNNAVRDALYLHAPSELPLADRKSFVDEVLTRIENAIDPLAARVTVRVYQDHDDREHLRLTGEQASDLLAQPGVDTLIGLRDTALIAILLCAGLREGELVSLVTDDLYASLGGEPAVRIQHGKGNKTRLVPYGDMLWSLKITEQWLRKAEIYSGPVFRGVYKGGKSIRPTALTTRAVEYILAAYPITIDGRTRWVKPHDCRRTYARRLYESGMDLVAIQQNLGHSDVKTTLRYIGALGADRRRAKALYGFDMSVFNDS